MRLLRKGDEEAALSRLPPGAIGLGILGFDPITAVFLLSLGMRREKNTKISLFMLSFAGFSVFVGAAPAVVSLCLLADSSADLLGGNDLFCGRRHLENAYLPT